MNVSEGEYATAGALSSPLVMLGDVSRLHVRVDIDENIAWRYRAGMPATVFLRGNRDLSAPLRFVRVEPYVLPKTSLTGDTTERVDIRVLQVLYAFDAKDMPAYVGQQVDVYFDDTGHGAASLSGERDTSLSNGRGASLSGGRDTSLSGISSPSGSTLQKDGQFPEVVVPVRDAGARAVRTRPATGTGVRG